jgi:hypothetical protein
MRVKSLVLICSVVVIAPAVAGAQANAPPAAAASPDPSTAREQAMRARFEARLQRERDARAAAAQQEAAAEGAARAAAQQQEDAEMAPLRARLGPGFGTACPGVGDEPVSPPASPATVRAEMAPGVPRDTLDDVAKDRAALAGFRTDFEALRCYAIERVVSLPLAVQQELRQKANVPMPTTVINTSVIPYKDWINALIILEPQAKSWVAQREQDLVADEACIATKGCVEARMVQRAADDVCADLAQRAQVEADIAKEHRYGQRTGAIDLSLLHDLGDQVRALDDQIPDAKARYARLAKKPFKQSLCR